MPVISFAAGNEPDFKVPDSTRFERLAGLCRLWGVVKYFHPYLAYKDIDWDKALIKTIPRVEKAETVEDYKRAIEYLLSFLKDPNTYIQDDSYFYKSSKISDLPDDEPYPAIIWTEDSIAIVVASDFKRLLRTGSRNPWYRRDYFLDRNAKGVVIDIRCLAAPAEDEGKALGSGLSEFVSGWLPILIQDTMMVPSVRYRSYFANPNRPEPMSGFNYQHSETTGWSSAPRDSLPIVFVLNEGSADLLTLLGGVQAIKQGAIIYEGRFDREGGIDTYEVILPEDIRVEVRLSEIVKPDGTESVHPDLVIPFTTDTTLLDCPPITTAFDIIRGTRQVPPVVGRFLSPVVPRRTETEFEDMSYRKMENRLLGLFQFWNRIRYFYAYPDVAGESWNEALLEYLPACRDAETLRDYNLAMAGLISRLHDSNAGITDGLSDTPFFEHYPSFEVDLIDGKTVITHMENGDNDGRRESDKPSAGLEPGDIILSANGEDINLLRKRLEKYLSASSPQAMLAKTNTALLGHTNSSPLVLTVQKENGQVEEIETKRYGRASLMYRSGPFPEAYHKLDGDIRYLRPDAGQNDAFKDSLDDILSSPGLIVDLRGRWLIQKNDSGIDSLLPCLADSEAVFCMRRQIERHSPDPGEFSFAYVEEKVFPDSNCRYRGEMVVLIDKTTKGEGERLCLYLEAAANVTLVGMPTNGTPGLPTTIYLPGESRPGLRVDYTSVDYRYPDDRAVHGVGIQPDIFVEPTIEGIRQGRDEILEAAIKFLEKELKK